MKKKIVSILTVFLILTGILPVQADDSKYITSLTTSVESIHLSGEEGNDFRVKFEVRIKEGEKASAGDQFVISVGKENLEVIMETPSLEEGLDGWADLRVEGDNLVLTLTDKAEGAESLKGHVSALFTVRKSEAGEGKIVISHDDQVVEVTATKPEQTEETVVDVSRNPDHRKASSYSDSGVEDKFTIPWTIILNDNRKYLKGDVYLEDTLPESLEMVKDSLEITLHTDVGGEIVGKGIRQGDNESGWNIDVSENGFRISYKGSPLALTSITINYKTRVKQGYANEESFTNSYYTKYLVHEEGYIEGEGSHEEFSLITSSSMSGRFPEKGQILIIKQDYEDSSIRLEGAVLKVVKDGKVVAEVTTDEHGEAVLEGVTAGAYYIYEVKAPEGYELMEQDDYVQVNVPEGAEVGYEAIVRNKRLEEPSIPEETPTEPEKPTTPPTPPVVTPPKPNTPVPEPEECPEIEEEGQEDDGEKVSEDKKDEVVEEDYAEEEAVEEAAPVEEPSSKDDEVLPPTGKDSTTTCIGITLIGLAIIVLTLSGKE